MKKILAMIFVVIMVFSLVGCNSKMDPSVEPNPPIEVPSDTQSTIQPITPSDDLPDVIVPEYMDDDVIVILDGEDIVFTGNATMTWEIEGHDDGIKVMQNEETIVMTPAMDGELTVSIICPNVVKYFITITKQPANDPTVWVERLELGDVLQPTSGTSYEDIDNMLELIYSTIPEETYPPSVMSTELQMLYQEDGGYNWVFGVEELDGLEYGVVSEPAISSQAYSLIIIKFDTNVHAEKAVEELMKEPPLNKWVCVAAEKASAKVVNDTYVIFMMATDELISEVEKVQF